MEIMKILDKNVVIFDLDGTITDSEEGIINSLKYTFKKYGFTDYEDNKLKKYLGPPLQETFMEVLGFDEHKAKDAVEVYREYFRDIGIFENKLYEGIEKVLKELSDEGKMILLATSKAEIFAKRILDHFKISDYFTFIGGSELDGSRSRKSEVINYAIENAGVKDLKKVVMVGDRKHDIIGAKEIGIDSIGVLYGYGNREELDTAGATLVVETIESLRRVLINFTTTTGFYEEK